MSSFFWRGADKIDKVCLADAQNLGLELQLHAEARASGRGHMPSRVRVCSRAEREAEGAGGEGQRVAKRKRASERAEQSILSSLSTHASERKRCRHFWVRCRHSVVFRPCLWFFVRGVFVFERNMQYVSLDLHS